MIKYWADKWIAALESGEYEQGPGALRLTPEEFEVDKATYCCLGVLCDVVNKALGYGEWVPGGFLPEGGQCVHNGYLPDAVKEIVGLSARNPVLYQDFEPYNRNVTCSEANDARDQTFTQIAQHVRVNYSTM